MRCFTAFSMTNTTRKVNGLHRVGLEWPDLNGRPSAPRVDTPFRHAPCLALPSIPVQLEGLGNLTLPRRSASHGAADSRCGIAPPCRIRTGVLQSVRYVNAGGVSAGIILYTRFYIMHAVLSALCTALVSRWTAVRLRWHFRITVPRRLLR
jgi:hypothetical protein